MEAEKLFLSLKCPQHKDQLIGVLDTNLASRKLGYCYDCYVESRRLGKVPKMIKSLNDYAKDISDFYEKCRQRAQFIGEPPLNYTEELSKKEERLERLSHHISQEKDKIARIFEEKRKNITQIDEKEKECLQILDKEISALSRVYVKLETLLVRGWPKLSEIEGMYPGLEALKQKISKIESIEQLQSFMAEVEEDIRIEDVYSIDREEGQAKITREMDRLVECLRFPEDSLPKVDMSNLTSENGLTIKDGLKSVLFTQQEVKVENSILDKIRDGEFELLKVWLLTGDKFDVKSSVEGYTARQYAKYQELVEDLKEKKNEDLKNMLRANDQPASGNKDDLISKVADGKVLGKIPRCPQCFGGRPRFDYKRGIYYCPGYRDDFEYKNCPKEYTLEELTREEWQDSEIC